MNAVFSEEQLCERVFERLRGRARKLLAKTPLVKRWERTDDILNESVVRLLKAMRAAKVKDEDHLVAMAAQCIRWTLLDLLRRYLDAHSYEAYHESLHEVPISSVAVERSEIFSSVVAWAEYLNAVGKLKDDERKVFDYTWGLGLSVDEVAQRLGKSESTVRKHRLNAKSAICKAMEQKEPSL